MVDRLNERETEILVRLSAGRTDQQIADELFLSLNTVKWYNRQIYSKLGVKSRTQAIASAYDLGLLEKAAPVSPSRRMPQSKLPVPPTRFIGRNREIADLNQRLGASRLLTLTGAGGTGKTRLALRVATEAADRFANGVYFVDLAPLADHTLVPKAIAQSLGVFENPAEPLLETLKRAIAERELLLLIDNFEHVVEAAPRIAELLAASPRLKILATSREPLRLSGEQEYPVPPLSLPASGAVSVRNLTESEAGALFVQRARMALPHFAATEENAPAIAQICARLDGLPLALELAAARCKLLTPQALLERLAGPGDHSPLQTLAGGSRDAPPRQRTLRDSIEWSYNLLDEGEQILFARLSVFRGGCSLEAIESVCAEGLPLDIFDGFASLVDKSLVQQKEMPDGEPRFVLLEMIHEYARERLEMSGEAEAMRRAHAHYFVTLAERAEPELRLAHYDDWCERFQLELDNIRAVLSWTLSEGQAPHGASDDSAPHGASDDSAPHGASDDSAPHGASDEKVTLGVRLAAALGLFWYGKGHHVEGARWTEQLLARLEDAPAMYQLKFLISAGHIAWMTDLETAQRLLARAVELSRALGDRLQMAWALACLGYATQKEPETAVAMAEEALALFRALDHRPGIAQTLNILGEIARSDGDDSRARRAYEECLAICRTTGETRRIGYMLTNLGYIAQHEGEHERALALARQALQLARDRNAPYDAAWTLELIAGSIGAMGDLQSAARLLSASEAALERMGSFRQPTDQPEHERIAAALRARLDEATFHIAWQEGRSMTLEQATAYALQD